jgi:glycosyltransferase involved in cell wall biosynthesis
VQVLQTARNLVSLGLAVDVLLTSQEIDYRKYDLLHFTNITRPADMLYHINRSGKPFVVSPVLVDYSEYDRKHRHGISGMLLSFFSANGNEYIKTCARWITRKDGLRSPSYLWKGQRSSIREVLSKAAVVLPNSEKELRQLVVMYGKPREYSIVPNGVDNTLFQPGSAHGRDEKLVLCAARIEGIKNQLNLIRALNGTSYTLLLVGAAAPNQREYLRTCRRIAAKNIVFREHVPQEALLAWYQQAKVHALPSWFETCGLSSLEAAAAGCNVTITDKGYTREYFGSDAFYCDPGSPESIYNAVESASRLPARTTLQQKILREYTWKNAAVITAEAYKKAIST